MPDSRICFPSKGIDELREPTPVITAPDSTAAEVEEIMDLLRPHSIDRQAKVRIGAMHDGGYVVPEIVYQSNLLISIGVGDEVSFDLDLANRGTQVFQFDHTIAKPPATHHNMHFVHKGWGTRETGSGNLLSLRQIAASADWTTAVHPVLKFDIEGAEWDCLLATECNDFERFEIIVGEFHNLEAIARSDGYKLVRGALSKLFERHKLIHLHANNNASVYSIHGMQVPSVVELTFFRQDCGVLTEYSDEPIPGRLDRPNNGVFPDIRIPIRTEKPVSTSSTKLPAGFGINLFGQLSSSTGLGGTARQTARALAESGLPLACYDLAPYYPSYRPDSELDELRPHLTRDPAALRNPVNLYCIPAIEFGTVLSQVPWLAQTGRFHAGVVWWEATKLHASWKEALCRFDALVAYSPFIAGVMANNLPLTPVLSGKQPLYLPDEPSAPRSAFGLPMSATVFVASFDPSSDPVRKNPHAVIEAFRLAFAQGHEDVRLVFRLNNADSSPMARAATAQLVEVAKGDSRIGFALEPMSYAQVLSLYACADVFVSLHRSEGLGLGMLEAMRLGIPVIATGWSGNMAFMDNISACLVRYQLVQTIGSHPFYRPEALGPDALWADPVIADAMAWMRRLHGFPEERRRIGEAGRERAIAYQQQALELSWVRELAELWQNSSLLPVVTGKLSQSATPFLHRHAQ